jgi:hypothetical protein
MSYWRMLICRSDRSKRCCGTLREWPVGSRQFLRFSRLENVDILSLCSDHAPSRVSRLDLLDDLLDEPD